MADKSILSVTHHAQDRHAMFVSRINGSEIRPNESREAVTTNYAALLETRLTSQRNRWSTACMAWLSRIKLLANGHRSMRNSKFLVALAAASLIAAAAPARAVDGCKVLLCLAGPWRNIPACVREVEQLFEDLWNGDPFPSCTLASGSFDAPDASSAGTPGGANAANAWLAQWTPQPDPNCPPQDVMTFFAMGRSMYGCRYSGVITVHVAGRLWSKTYWNVNGSSFTDLSAAAQGTAAVAAAQASGGGGE
jgi:hypothetical protein